MAEGFQNISAIQNIKKIKQNTKNFTLLARVTNKSAIKQIKANMTIFGVDLIDSDGIEVSGSFFNEACNKFYDTITTGKKCHIMLNFDMKSIVEQIQDDQSIPYMKLNQIDIKQIRKMNKNENIDIVGVIHEATPINRMTIKNETKMKRTLKIFDQSKVLIECTIWGDLCNKEGVEQDSYIVIKDAKVGEYQGIKNIAFNFGSNLYINDFNIKEVQNLKLWYEDIQKKTNGSSQNIGGSLKSSVFKLSNIDDDELDINILEIDSIASLDEKCQFLSKGEEKSHFVRAFIGYLKQDGKMYYIACNKNGCAKKAIPKDNGFVCENHGLVEDTLAKYITNVKIMDQSGFIFANMFDEVAQKLLDMPAQDLRYLVEGNNLPQIACIINKNIYQEYYMKITSKMDAYNGQEQVRHLISKIIKPDLLQEANDYISIIQAYEDFTIKGVTD